MTLQLATQFRRDVTRQVKRGKNLEKLWRVVRLIESQAPLPASLKDHPLAGKWKGWRDCHIEPDWVLIYRVANDTLHLERTGRHQDLFDGY